MTGAASRPSAYESAVRSWAAHLSSGGTTPWQAWRREQHHPVVAGAGPLPGAAQLELVRRLAASPHAAGLADFRVLAERLLATSAPGRGPGELPLAWPDPAPEPASDPTPGRYGIPAVDPGTLDAEELLRAGTGGLADLLADVQAPAPRSRRRLRLTRPWRRSFTVQGTPLAAARVRAALLRAGLAEGGPRATHLVVGAPFDVMMAEHWVHRVSRGASLPWERLWRHAANTGRLPPAVAVDEVAVRLAGQFGPARVLLLVAGSADEAVAAARVALDVRVPAGSNDPVAGPPLDTISAEVLRRVNGVLRLRLDADRRRELGRQVLPSVVAHDGASPIGPARGTDGWAHEAAEQLVEGVSAGGYPVHGDPRLLLPVTTAADPRWPDRAAAVELVIAALARAWALERRTTEED